MSNTAEIRFPIVAGALVRRPIRAKLDLLGLRWTEHKGLLESTFVVRGSRDQRARFLRWARSAGITDD